MKPFLSRSMRITRTIAFRLFLLIATVQTVVLVLLTYAVLHVQETSLMKDVQQSAFRLSDLVRRATQHSMMLNRKEDVNGIIQGVAGEPGIEGIRIYNKEGRVIFATIPGDLNSTVDMNAEACVSCHPYGGLENPHSPSDNLSRIFASPSGERILGLITPIRNDPECSGAACHAHPASKTILGVLDVKMSLSQVDSVIAESRRELLYLSIGAVLVVGLISGAFIWSGVRRPVKRLVAVMERVTGGDLEGRLLTSSTDELGQLARTFNEMTEELSRARRELTDWSETLELKVREKTADLERVHREMVKVEKMASLGNLASGIAHELNNPLEGIVTFSRLLMKRIAKSGLPPEVAQTYLDDLRLMADEAMRCGNIVKNLLTFARQRGAAFQEVQLGPVIERCGLLMNHHAGMHNVALRTSCSVSDPIEMDPNQIQQVLIALMVNAVEAMGGGSAKPEGGTLDVDVRPDADPQRVALRITDSGVGMDEETKSHIFEPFFTMKSEAKGVGLGLSVAYGIVERHHGTIDVASVPGHGTTFTISLPRRQSVEGPPQSLPRSVEGDRV